MLARVFNPRLLKSKIRLLNNINALYHLRIFLAHSPLASIVIKQIMPLLLLLLLMFNLIEN